MTFFHGNFFVRSTDLLAMPTVPQDQSYAVEIQIEEIIMSPFIVFQTPPSIIAIGPFAALSRPLWACALLLRN